MLRNRRKKVPKSLHYPYKIPTLSLQNPYKIPRKQFRKGYISCDLLVTLSRRSERVKRIEMDVKRRKQNNCMQGEEGGARQENRSLGCEKGSQGSQEKVNRRGPAACSVL